MSVLLPTLILGLVALGAAGWAVWQRYVKPARIPDIEIERTARDMLVRNGDDPLRLVRIETYQAWLDGDLEAQGKWRRVESLLKKRLMSRAS